MEENVGKLLENGRTFALHAHVHFCDVAIVTPGARADIRGEMWVVARKPDHWFVCVFVAKLQNARTPVVLRISLRFKKH